MIYLGIDPGFANLGFAVVRLQAGGLEAGGLEDILEMGCVRTEKASRPPQPRKKKGQPRQRAAAWHPPTASEDNYRRTQEIVGALDRLLSTYNPGVVCVEAMSYPRNASAASKMSLAWGALAALGHFYGFQIRQVTPKQIKQALAAKTRDKSEIIEALNRRYGTVLARSLKRVPKSLHEHPYDALAAIRAVVQS